MIAQEMKLSECCVSISDGDHLPPPKAESGVPFVTIANIDSTNHFDFSNTMFVPQSYYDSVDDKRKAKEGDVLYSVVGSFGIPVLIKEEKPFVFQRHIAILRPDKNKIDPRFLYYTMLSRDFYAKADAAALGAAQRTISLTSLRSIKVKIPAIQVQQKIADTLSVYDSLIENNRRQIKLLEEAAQRLYKEWFVNLRFPGYECTKIVDGVPEGWSETQLGKVFSFVRGKSYTSAELSDSDGILLVNLKNMQAWGGYKRNAEKRFIGTYKENQVLSEGDIVMAVTDMTQERRLVGHVALVPKLPMKAVCSMDLIKVLPADNIPQYYLYSLLRFSGIAEEIAKHANGTNVLHLRPETITTMSTLIADANTTIKFDGLVQDLYSKVELLETQITKLSEARDRLLPKLMSGEIEV